MIHMHSSTDRLHRIYASEQKFSPYPLGQLTVLLRLPNWIWGSDPLDPEGTQREKREESEGVEEKRRQKWKRRRGGEEGDKVPCRCFFFPLTALVDSIDN